MISGTATLIIAAVKMVAMEPTPTVATIIQRSKPSTLVACAIAARVNFDLDHHAGKELAVFL